MIEEHEKEFILRKAILESNSLDETERSIEAIGATETPARIWDPERYEAVDEILLMSGCQIPAGEQVPVTIEHIRSAESVIGSYRDMRIEGTQLVGRVFFASDPDADKFFVRVRERHLDSFSVVYRADSRESVWVPENQSMAIEGKEFKGPVLITKRWTPSSLGLVIYGADSNAKVRSEIDDKTENKSMEKVRARLIEMGLSPTATETEMDSFLAALPKTETVRADMETERADIKRVEIARSTEITAMCDKFAIEPEKRNEMIRSGESVDVVRAKILDILADRNKPTDGPGVKPAVIVADAWDKFRSAAEDGLIIRSGLTIEKPAPGALDLAGYSMLELARHALHVTNKPTGGSKLEMIGRALTTSDFPYLLANVANKSLFAGWDSAQETWSEWCATGSVPDFKLNYLPRVSELDDLEEIPEGMEYKYGGRTEGQESFKIVTYGKMLAITRQAIINDDLSAMTDVPRAHGEAAARKVGDLPYAVLTANAAMGDGEALFSVAHANYVASGSGAAPGVTTLAAAILAMGVQKDLAGKRRLNIRPVYFIGPKALEGAAEVFFRTDRFSDHSTVATDSSFASTRVNPYSGTVLTRIYDARLDDDDAAAWYLAAMKGKTVTVFFLNGQQRPYMETQQGWNVDGVEYKVRIDAGAKAVDWKGLYYNDGN